MIWEPLTPDLVQGPQRYFPFRGIVLSFQKRAPCLHLERTRWGSWAWATRRTPSRAPHRYLALLSPDSLLCLTFWDESGDFSLIPRSECTCFEWNYMP